MRSTRHCTVATLPPFVGADGRILLSVYILKARFRDGDGATVNFSMKDAPSTHSRPFRRRWRTCGTRSTRASPPSSLTTSWPSTDGSYVASPPPPPPLPKPRWRPPPASLQPPVHRGAGAGRVEPRRCRGGGLSPGLLGRFRHGWLGRWPPSKPEAGPVAPSRTPPTPPLTESALGHDPRSVSDAEKPPSAPPRPPPPPPQQNPFPGWPGTPPPPAGSLQQRRQETTKEADDTLWRRADPGGGHVGGWLPSRERPAEGVAGASGSGPPQAQSRSAQSTPVGAGQVTRRRAPPTGCSSRGVQWASVAPLREHRPTLVG